MTWYANQIFGPPRPEVVAALRAEFPGGVFLLHDLPVGWEPGSGPLPMPAEGLLVVRELCHPHNSGRPSSWFDEDGISWLLCDDHPGEPVFIPDRVSAEGTEGVHYPPAALLRFLSWLSAETDSVLSLYCVGYWGGDVDYAYSWVFEGRSGAGKVYIDAGDEVLVWDRRVPSDHPRELIQSGYVLLHTLDHHGVYLDGGYFDAHRRGFDWQPYRVD